MKNTGTVTAVSREAYEVKVGIEAVQRVGNNPNLKGVVHEIMAKDAVNLSPSNVVTQAKCVLAKSPTAGRDDLLVMQAGKVIKRAQLKDTPASIGKTVKQVTSSKYRGTNLMGTKETVKAYNEAVAKLADKGVTVSQKMTSTRISSQDTARIATKTLGTSAGRLTAASVGRVAVSSGAAGAVISCGIETVSSGIRFAKGEIGGDEFMSNVAKETASGGLAAAGGTVAATVVATGAATVLATTTAPVWIPAAVGVGAAVAVGTGIKRLWDGLFG